MLHHLLPGVEDLEVRGEEDEEELAGLGGPGPAPDLPASRETGTVLSPALLVRQPGPARLDHWPGWLAGRADLGVVVDQLGLQHELPPTQPAVVLRLAGGRPALLQALVSRLVDLLVGQTGEHLATVTTAQLLPLLSLHHVTFLVEFPHVNLTEQEAAVPAVHPVGVLRLHRDRRPGLQLLLDELDPLLLVQFV